MFAETISILHELKLFFLFLNTPFPNLFVVTTWYMKTRPYLANCKQTLQCEIWLNQIYIAVLDYNMDKLDVFFIGKYSNLTFQTTSRWKYAWNS